MKDATRVVRAGRPEASQGAPFLPGPVFAAPFHLTGDPAHSSYTYGRHHNPTWSAYESAISDLEYAAGTTVFSSGMAAISAVLGVALQAGDFVILPADGYHAGRSLAVEVFAKFGIEAKLLPTGAPPSAVDLQRAKLLWLESPSNPHLNVCDIAALSDLAHEAGVLVAVDNTTPSCLGQQPLRLDADFSLASDTKITTGHSDIVLGHVSVRDRLWTERLESWRRHVGAIAGPMEVWLAHRSLATLHLRLERQSQNALEVATFLRERPDVLGVRYPGLPSDPSFEIASRQMKFFGPVVSFVLKSRSHAEQFLECCKLVLDATSFGGLHTTAERRARWAGDSVEEGFIRLSVGCEDAGDLVQDLAKALEVAAAS